MYSLHDISSLNTLRCLSLTSDFVLLCLLNAADQIHAGECSCACNNPPSPPYSVSQLPSPVNLKQTHGIPREWPASEITDRCIGRKGTPSVVWLRAPARRQLWLQLGDCSVNWRQRGPPAARWRTQSMRQTNVIWQAPALIVCLHAGLRPDLDTHFDIVNPSFIHQSWLSTARSVTNGLVSYSTTRLLVLQPQERKSVEKRSLCPCFSFLIVFFFPTVPWSFVCHWQSALQYIVCSICVFTYVTMPLPSYTCFYIFSPSSTAPSQYAWL